MEYGEIKRFDVTADCPHCGEETDVTREEANDGVVTCQHCDKPYKIIMVN
tara:strand:+ start:221 stop:370 length:150 start_codon:yes stop_codon:yes gene_type:complete